MKKNFHLRLLLGLLTALAPVACSAQIAPTNFFVDTFNNGSTINSATPVPPTTNSASYETISSKSWMPPSSVVPNQLRFGITNTTSGTTEIQALFATNAVNLVAAGTDYIQLIIVFTNTSGTLLTTGQGFLGFGLYNSAQATNYPVPGGLNGTATTSFTTNITANATTWQGYFAQVAYSGSSSAIITRPIQNSGTLANNCQDLLTTGSGSESFKYPTGANVGSTVTSALTLGTNLVYTELLTIALNTPISEAITNTLYAGPTTNGTVLAQFGGVATNATLLTQAFNALAMGWNQKVSVTGIGNVVDISSITVTGYTTPVNGPPSITSQPSSVLVATNGSCAFEIASSGFDVTYQWKRHGTNLNDSGNISGTKSSQLVVSPATTTDQLSVANGYYCVVTGAGNFSTNSITNSLTLITATNLIWTDNSPNNAWIVNDPSTANWQDTNGNAAVFNYGDPVTFDDTGAGGFVNLSNNYLSAASVTINSSGLNSYTFQGSGSIAGPGPLDYIGSARLILNANNTYSGGTLISNATAYVLLQNYGGLGTGPVTFGLNGGQMEIVPAGTASTGIAGNIVVADNFTTLLDANSSFGAVFLGDMSGTVGKTLSFLIGPSNPNTNQTRIRAFGNATVYNANINLNNNNITFASYGSAGSQTYNGVISGPGAFMEKGTLTILNGPNTYTGGTSPAQGVIGVGINSVGSPGSLTSGPLGTGPIFLAPDSTTSLTGSGMIEASVNNITIGNAIQYPTGTNNLTLQIGGTNNLTLSGAFTLQGNDGVKTNTFTSRTIQNTNAALTTISGVISDGGKVYGLTVTGGGTLALNNNETYTGPTTNNGGTLLVNGTLATASITLTTNGFLGGTGTITAPVTAQFGGGVAPGNLGIGTLTINNALTLLGGSTNTVKVNKGAGTHDLIVATSIAYNGTLFATNLSGTITMSDTFHVFSPGSESGNFTNVVGTPGPGLAWAFNATSGTLSVVQGVNLTPTNIIFSVSGGNLNMSWPADHLGWSLQVQTNSLAKGIGTNWVTVPNSSNVTSTNFPLVSTNGAVFYRMIYP